jgi:Chaperone of endosialidase
MNQPISLKTTTVTLRNSISPAATQDSFLVVVLAVASLALFPIQDGLAVTPAPDGGYANENTAEGTNALKALTTGADNTAVGFQALFSNKAGDGNTATGARVLLSNTDGSGNTATGASALQANTSGSFNTATGVVALLSNTTGGNNTANGYQALVANTTGSSNTASGVDALFSNTAGSANTATGNCALSFNDTGTNNTATGAGALNGSGDSPGTGDNNTATGAGALFSGTSGNNNTATGFNSLGFNSTGNNNTASGFNALTGNRAGNNNTAEGFQALKNNTGSNNVALGANAGINLTTGNNNIHIGALGVAGESNTIRIGKQGVQKIAYMQGISGATVPAGATVIVDIKGHLGTVQSSARFKDEIKPMDKASEAILALKPVMFRYRHELDPEGTPQFGLISEEVEKVNPDLVARDEKGQAYTVRYEAVNAMLLNEFLKEHRKVEQLEATVAQQRKDFEAVLAQQHHEFQMQREQVQAVTTRLKEQAAQIQRVSTQLEFTKSASQIVTNDQ